MMKRLKQSRVEIKKWKNKQQDMSWARNVALTINGSWSWDRLARWRARRRKIECKHKTKRLLAIFCGLESKNTWKRPPESAISHNPRGDIAQTRYFFASKFGKVVKRWFTGQLLSNRKYGSGGGKCAEA